MLPETPCRASFILRQSFDNCDLKSWRHLALSSFERLSLKLNGKMTMTTTNGIPKAIKDGGTILSTCALRI
jgi:hypothetical protein